MSAILFCGLVWQPRHIQVQDRSSWFCDVLGNFEPDASPELLIPKAREVKETQVPRQPKKRARGSSIPKPKPTNLIPYRTLMDPFKEALIKP